MSLDADERKWLQQGAAAINETTANASPSAPQLPARDPTNLTADFASNPDLLFHSQYSTLNFNMSQPPNQPSQSNNRRSSFGPQTLTSYNARPFNMGYLVNSLPANYPNAYGVGHMIAPQGSFQFDPNQNHRQLSPNALYNTPQGNANMARTYQRSADPRLNHTAAYLPYTHSHPAAYGSFTPHSGTTLHQDPSRFHESRAGPSIPPTIPGYIGHLGTLAIPTQSQQPAPRGPPRKPRQSGHALWVGNLPLGATITDLKDHFAREATNDIESLKLISKSSCAFVNYRTATACQAAMNRFHDSRFHGTRLVCRLRRPSNVSPSSPTSPIKASLGEESEVRSTPAVDTGFQEEGRAEQAPKQPERFFVLKSLTVHDLEMSTRNGIWATQAHNESMLNEAYKNSEYVYLIFSANKSGEYFGYARMTSQIPAPDLSEQTETPSPVPAEAAYPTSNLYQFQTGPKMIPTPATDWAPRGHIIDDSARGTIFWEAETADQPYESSHSQTPEEVPSTPANLGTATVTTTDSAYAPREPIIASSDVPATTSTTEESTTIQKQSLEDDADAPGYGRSFRVVWMSTRKVPFHRTRGLRNSRNANREVKIARDGTELDGEVGRKLLGLFGGNSNVGFAPVQGPLVVGEGVQ